MVMNLMPETLFYDSFAITVWHKTFFKIHAGFRGICRTLKGKIEPKHFLSLFYHNQHCRVLGSIIGLPFLFRTEVSDFAREISVDAPPYLSS